ncbi:ATP-binding cassette domain-containing protein [uncultured Oxalicibacterium sp.]|uniref:ATP-binding cassette domain-containing protein n=1 Tax=uncultured Oxalicibacterium sp. TaxID=1168540 RepID=UPI0025DC19A6|nr:ATP-binding cassette domain-containing protein [uncultured Oxalicibacterium sp.]
MSNELKSVSATNADVAGRGVRVKIDDLFKSFNGRQVLKAIELDIAPGEFVAVVGRSGCGKSTLLRLIADLEEADHGHLHLGDTGKRPETRIMFQDSRLLPWKRVLDNVALGLQDKQAARVALRQVGLEERAGEWPAVLSGGQRQRVALARALVHNPELLLLDEPLGALDALTRIEMQQLIESLWQERGFTAVLVTHDVQEAIALADRVVLIEDGRITLDQRIDLARPRARGNAAFARLEESILLRVLQQPASTTDLDSVLGDVSLLKSVNQFAWAV